MRTTQATVEQYFDVWNETDPAARKDRIAATWTEDASYLDPMLSGEGHEGIDAMVAALQTQLPGHRFYQVGAIDSHSDRVRFAWKLVGPDGGTPVFAGTDFGVIAGDGRIQSITGFLDATPRAAGD